MLYKVSYVFEISIYLKKHTAVYFLFGLSILVISIVKFLITCLVCEILKDKKEKTLVLCHFGYSKKPMTSFLQETISKYVKC